MHAKKVREHAMMEEKKICRNFLILNIHIRFINKNYCCDQNQIQIWFFENELIENFSVITLTIRIEMSKVKVAHFLSRFLYFCSLVFLQNLFSLSMVSRLMQDVFAFIFLPFRVAFFLRNGWTGFRQDEARSLAWDGKNRVCVC